MLNDREITEIKIWDFVSAEIDGDILKAKYKASHPKITDGHIIIEIELNQFIYKEIHTERNFVSNRLYGPEIGMAIPYEPQPSIRTILDTKCKFELSYKMKETPKEMTLDEVEKALGHKVKIVNR